MEGRIPLEDASGFSGYADRLYTPASAAEVAAILAEASAARIPVNVIGGGTGLTGGAVPRGGWAISTRSLHRLEVSAGRAIAGAGVLLQDLQTAAAAREQFYAPDPTESAATVGGSIATNASGSRSFRYGSTRRHILSLEVAFLDGSLRRFFRGQTIDFPVPAIRTPDTTKHTAGFQLRPAMDWVDLFTGSEGTLGVITEAELVLLPRPRALLTGVVFFDCDEAALDAVDAWRSVPALRMLEYLDAASLRLLAVRYPDIPAQAGAALLVEQELVSEADPEMDLWPDRLELAGADLDSSWFASSEADRERFRRFRHALPELINDTVRRNGFQKLGSDYAVPVAKNRQMLAFYRRRLEQDFPGRYVIFGHIGDAHLHVNILPQTQEDFDRGRERMLEFARHACALGGTVSAEHGLGKRKAPLLAIQYSSDEREAMRAVKMRFDPHWLLGRGNLFDPPD